VNMATRRNQLMSLAVFLILAAGSLPAQEGGQHLMNQDEVGKLVKKDKGHPEIIEKTLKDDGVDFDINPDIEKRMRKAGATDEILQAIWGAGPTIRNFKGAVVTSATGVPLTSTYKEAMGYETLEKESDPDTKIRMAMEFAQTFPQSNLLSYVFTQAASAFQQKGDYANAVKTARRSLELDPDNTYSLLITAASLSEPSMVQAPGGDSGKALQEAESDAEKVLELLPRLPARKDETAQQLDARKAGIAADANAALGNVAMQQGDLNQAIAEFNKAISLSPTPNPATYFRLGEVYSNAGKKQEAVQAFIKAAELGKGTVIETYANQSLQELKQK
jgi:tetratricopeptide (TPR) repeat protein